MGISALVLTYNNENNIAQCLEALSFADEICVLDSYSTDNTEAVVRSYTDKFEKKEFRGFSEQKNALVAMADNDWVLIIDSDEIVSDKLAKEILNAVESNENDAYKIPRLTYFLGKPVKHCGWYPDFQLRLAKREKAVFADRLIHETLDIRENVGVLKNNLMHYSYNKISDYTDKMTVYAIASAKQKYNDGRRSRITDLLFTPISTFIKMYFLKQGFRDGLTGFIVSYLSSCSAFLKYLHLRELENNNKEQVK